MNGTTSTTPRPMQRTIDHLAMWEAEQRRLEGHEIPRWRRNPNEVKANEIELWLSGGTMAGMISRAVAQRLVRDCVAFVLWGNAIQVG
jgi:hypothetical protein